MVNELTTSVSVQQTLPPVVSSQPQTVQKVDVAGSSSPSVDNPSSGGGNNIPSSAPSNSPTSREDVVAAVQKMQDFLQAIDRDLHFSIDEQSGMTVVKVVDPSTDKVVRQIPSEEVMRVVHSLESGGGLLSSVKA